MPKGPLRRRRKEGHAPLFSLPPSSAVVSAPTLSRGKDAASFPVSPAGSEKEEKRRERGRGANLEILTLSSSWKGQERRSFEVPLLLPFWNPRPERRLAEAAAAAAESVEWNSAKKYESRRHAFHPKIKHYKSDGRLGSRVTYARAGSSEMRKVS